MSRITYALITILALLLFFGIRDGCQDLKRQRAFADYQRREAKRNARKREQAAAAPAPSPVLYAPPPRSAPEPAPEPAMTPKQIYQAEVELLKLGTGEMKRLRDRGNFEGCVDLMQPALEEAKALFEQADPLPMELGALEVAANYLQRCVVCQPSLADDNCPLAKAELRRAKKALRKKK